MNKASPYIFLILIVFLASLLRFYKLANYPVGFHIDEASLGYNGYSLLKTGKDEHGNKLPLYIDMFGDNRPSGYHYLTILPISVFGLNEFATRFPGAFFGTTTVIAFYYLGLTLFHSRRIGILSSLFLAVSPWHVSLSRASSESIVALFFVIAGITLVIHSLIHKDIGRLIGGILILSISFFFYHTPRVFAPLLLVAILTLFLRNFRKFRRGFIAVSIMTCLGLFLVSFLLIFIVKGGTGRFSQVSIFGYPETKLLLEEQLREDGTQNIRPVVARVFHNKLLNYSLKFVSNYFDYFTGQFLFIRGGLPIWYRIPGVGLIYLVEIPIILVGCAYLYVEKNALRKIPLLWLFIAPLVAAVTTDDVPNIQRAIVMFPIIEIIAAYGSIRIFELLSKKNKFIFIFLFSAALVLNFLYFLHQYFIHGQSHTTIFRNNGFKEMTLVLKKEYNHFDNFIITKTMGGIYPSVLFFMNYDPATYQKEGSPKDKDFGGFGKFIFTPQFCPSIDGGDRYSKKRRILYVNNGTCSVSPFEKQEKIYREDGTVAFIIVYP